MTQFDSVMFWS